MPPIPNSESVHIVPHPSSPALCQSDAKGYLLPDYYFDATGTPGRFSEGLLLQRLHDEGSKRQNRRAREKELALYSRVGWLP
jgi:hypothetical protein